MPRMSNEEKLTKLQEKYAELQSEIKKVAAAASRDLRNKRTKTLIEIGAMTLALLDVDDELKTLDDWDNLKTAFQEMAAETKKQGAHRELAELLANIRTQNQ